MALRARRSARTTSMPFLSIRRSAALVMRRRTQRFSLSTQKRRYCRLGRNRRLVLLLAWETLFPTIGPLPVTSHTRAMWTLFHAQLAPNEPRGSRNRALRGVLQLDLAKKRVAVPRLCRDAQKRLRI